MQHSTFYNQLVKDGTLIEFMQQVDYIFDYLDCAFTWENSPSGNTYWSNLADNYGNDSHLSNYDINILKNVYPEYFI